MAVDLGHPIWGTRVKTRRLGLGYFLHQSEHLGGGGLIETRLRRRGTQCVQYAHDAHCVGIGSIYWRSPGCANEALSCEIVKFVGLQEIQNTKHRVRLAEVEVVQMNISID